MAAAGARPIELLHEHFALTASCCMGEAAGVDALGLRLEGGVTGAGDNPAWRPVFRWKTSAQLPAAVTSGKGLAHRCCRGSFAEERRTLQRRRQFFDAALADLPAGAWRRRFRSPSEAIRPFMLSVGAMSDWSTAAS